MVVGLGMDMVEVARIEASIERFGPRFLDRLFTQEEQSYCARRGRPAQHFAARFAAKEAAAKALGTGIRADVGWLDLEVESAPGKPPALHFHGGAARLAQTYGTLRLLLTLTHTDTSAGAVVLLETVETGK
jgi:holo-[acyl-carrier protein] synthase